MLRLGKICVISLTLVLLFTLCAAAQAILRDELAPLKPLIGKHWIGEFANSTPENPVRDETSFEVILNGRAVRSVHSVNGQYGGETIFMWDAASERIKLWYFTNTGMYSEGWGEPVAGGITWVANNYNGGDVTAWKSTTTFNSDGTFSTHALYFEHGAWVEGHAVTYHEQSRTR